MKKYIFLAALLPASFSLLQAQETEVDTTAVISMNEVIVIGTKPGVARSQSKSLASIDEYLERSPRVNMIKRGAYAWEPVLNNMATERTVITIDGMRIFSACTDKMDPITSYVEISNLQEATISSGQQGGENGATIGGGIDLKRRKTGFRNSGWKSGVNTGGDSNGEQKIAGGEIGYGSKGFYFNTDFMYRDAENYFAGGNKEVLYTQFTKFNISAISGVKITPHRSLEASLIFDKATNVGYAGLPMDVSLARAVIGSLKYEHHMPWKNVDHWESKIYINTIQHEMDDSKRTLVPVRMDMPGWSDTYGFYSRLNMAYSNHKITGKINGFYNRSLAEMTMHPNDPAEAHMFMYTWPDVRTTYVGTYLEDLIQINSRLSLKLTATFGSHYNESVNEEGLAGLKIFYPGMELQTSRILPGTSAQLRLDRELMEYTVGGGYGERAPSVSEGYGFYIFNSFDAFDYIGNPGLQNECSHELNASAGFQKGKWKAKLSGNFFHIKDYIIGKPDESLSAMTIGANGVKVYEQLPYAHIINTDLVLGYNITGNWNWNAAIVWSRGQDNNGHDLPMIQPLSYNAGIQFNKGSFSAVAEVAGAGTQVNFSPEFGENETQAYRVINLSASKSLYINNQRMTVKMGAENLLDRLYSPYSSWNNIPSRGRNLFVNLRYEIL